MGPACLPPLASAAAAGGCTPPVCLVTPLRGKNDFLRKPLPYIYREADKTSARKHNVVPKLKTRGWAKAEKTIGAKS